MFEKLFKINIPFVRMVHLLSKTIFKPGNVLFLVIIIPFSNQLDTLFFNKLSDSANCNLSFFVPIFIKGLNFILQFTLLIRLMYIKLIRISTRFYGIWLILFYNRIFFHSSFIRVMSVIQSSISFSCSSSSLRI